MPLTVEEVSIYSIYQCIRILLSIISFTIWQYKIGQLYMIARHSLEQSAEGEGVEVIENEPCEDPVHGKGQYTEKRIHLSRWGREKMSTDGYIPNALHPLFAVSAFFSRLPYWIQAICPRVFYVTEKSWNYYPYTMTGKWPPVVLFGQAKHIPPIIAIWGPSPNQFSLMLQVHM